MLNFVSTTTAMATISMVSAFAPIAQQRSASSLNVASNSGWVPDENKFAYGLPGSLAPVAEFDPFGFASRADLGQMKKYREAEVTQ